MNDLEARKASISGDERVQDFRSLKHKIDDSKSRRRNEGSRASRPT